MYCPPDHPEFENYKWEFFRARKNTKLDFKNEADNSPAANMIFIFSTVKQMIPVLKLSKDEPVVLTILATKDDSDDLDLLKDPRYLKQLEFVDGLPLEEFLQKQKTPDESLKDLPSDNE